MPFSITCAACQKTFSIADDVYERKVKDRVVTIKCKQCHAGIRVDGTKETPVFSLSESVRPPAVAATPAVTAPKNERASAPGFTKPAEASKPAAAKPAPTATAPAPTAKAAPAPAAPKSAPNQAGRAQPFGVKPPPAAPAVKGGPTLAATQRAAVVATTPKAPPVGVRPPPAAPALKTPPVTPIAAPAEAEAASAAVPPFAETLWAVDYPDGEDRELTLLQIQQALASGAIDPTTLVWREGMAEWLEVGQVAELQSLVEAPKPAAPAQRPQAASAPDLPLQRPRAASAP
ncbi:MAG: GYF domain-containing protein, partial [Pseudomonadota bacterium]